MKETRSLLNTLVAGAVAFAMVSTLAAQTVNSGVAKVIRLKGAARYAAGPNVGQLLKVGDIIKPGTVIQTAAKSSVDFALGDGSAPVASAGASAAASQMAVSYQPTAEQNLVRMWENTLLSIDKLTITETGADVVTETQLDLKAGRIFGTVKKMSAASKYEVKIPTGVAGIRGTSYDISAEGVVKVLDGSVVVAYVGPDGTVATQVVMGGQQFDTRTGVLSQLPPSVQAEMESLVKLLPSGFAPPPTPVAADKTVIFISPQ
jgi:hypothetical protein